MEGEVDDWVGEVDDWVGGSVFFLIFFFQVQRSLQLVRQKRIAYFT